VNIAENAGVMRKFLRLENTPYFPVVHVYEALDLLYEGARFEVLEMHEMGGDHGRTYPDQNLIYIRADVYERACAGEGRDRFTMCHELGHLMMHRGVALSRIDPDNPPKIFRNSEWQADTFASFLMMPADLLANSSMHAAPTDFGVSFEAASARRADMKKA
jgi:Zn-dependent peptidase ImmA (M78 family)